jgi:hypothetical protein
MRISSSFRIKPTTKVNPMEVGKIKENDYATNVDK